jgi:hypothetical protein
MQTENVVRLTLPWLDMGDINNIYFTYEQKRVVPRRRFPIEREGVAAQKWSGPPDKSGNYEPHYRS